MIVGIILLVAVTVILQGMSQIPIPLKILVGLLASMGNHSTMRMVIGFVLEITTLTEMEPDIVITTLVNALKISTRPKNAKTLVLAFFTPCGSRPNTPPGNRRKGKPKKGKRPKLGKEMWE